MTPLLLLALVLSQSLEELNAACERDVSWCDRRDQAVRKGMKISRVAECAGPITMTSEGSRGSTYRGPTHRIWVNPRGIVTEWELVR